MSAGDFCFRNELPFAAETARETLRSVPEAPGICALFGQDVAAQPYLTRSANLRRRLARLLDAPEAMSRRLNLRDRVARIAWTATGSEFAALLELYNATSSLFGADEARRRLKLHTPYFLRLTVEHTHPRLYTTNRLSRAAMAQLYGPFPSRLAAERYCDAVLDLFRLRRCHEELQVHPDHPGCAYGEMRRCMAPCNTSCSAEEYSAEGHAVRGFLDSHGENLLAQIATGRTEASEAMDFERAAELHARWEKVKLVAALVDEIVRPIPELRALVAQAAAPTETDEHTHAQSPMAEIFLLRAGALSGPQPLSTLGIRAVREQTSVGSSLFAQPLMLQAVPLGEAATAESTAAESPETRAEAAIAALDGDLDASPRDAATLSDHLSLFRRWYFRPEKQRRGEVVLPNPDGSWPTRKLLRAAARAVLGDPKPMQATDREGAKVLRTKVLHAGRPDVERVVPDIAAVPVAVAETLPQAVFRSRRAPREQRS